MRSCLWELSTVGKSDARHRSSQGSIPTTVSTDYEILVAVTYRCCLVVADCLVRNYKSYIQFCVKCCVCSVHVSPVQAAVLNYLTLPGMLLFLDEKIAHKKKKRKKRSCHNL